MFKKLQIAVSDDEEEENIEGGQGAGLDLYEKWKRKNYSHNDSFDLENKSCEM